MSTLITDYIQGRQDNNYVVKMPDGHYINSPGQCVQTVYRIYDGKWTGTAGNSGNGVELGGSGLRLTMSPKYSNSVILLRWILHYELHHDCVFTVTRNNSIIGYNTQIGNRRSSGVAAPVYDRDYASTPSNIHIMWYDSPNTTSSRDWRIHARSANGSNRTISINRPLNNNGSNDNETGMSIAIAQEFRP